MAHSASPGPAAPSSKVTPLDLICFMALAAVLWWGAMCIAALTGRSTAPAGVHGPAATDPGH